MLDLLFAPSFLLMISVCGLVTESLFRATITSICNYILLPSYYVEIQERKFLIYSITESYYRIAGNFRMVQIFAYFA